MACDVHDTILLREAVSFGWRIVWCQDCGTAMELFDGRVAATMVPKSAGAPGETVSKKIRVTRQLPEPLKPRPSVLGRGLRELMLRSPRNTGLEKILKQ